MTDNSLRDIRRTGTSKTVDGVKFHCFRRRFGSLEWRTEDAQLCAGRFHGRRTFYAICGLERLNHRYRTLEGAMRGAIKHRSGRT